MSFPSPRTRDGSPWVAREHVEDEVLLLRQPQEFALFRERGRVAREFERVGEDRLEPANPVLAERRLGSSCQ